MHGRLAWVLLGAAALAAPIASCSKERTSPVAAPTFRDDVAPILDARCTECHGPIAPAASWSATSYLATIGCVDPSKAPAALPANASAPIVAALGDALHAGRSSSAERSVLAAWIGGGAPAFLGTVHPPGIVDPRSPDFHGAFLRARRWSPMLDGTDAQACGRCHDGAPSKPLDVSTSAPGATACTTCHANAGGALACDTCHGNGTKAYPPRDLCFFPADASLGGAHAAHVERSTVIGAGLPCSTCHPSVGTNVIGGLHGNGSVDVVFDAARVGVEASYDPTTRACAVSCHDRGGDRPRLTWNDPAPVTCTSCHASPPANHFRGACTSCHAEANADGTALTGGPLHLNGRVDLGNGNGTCGACHGTGSDPWPTTAAHPRHESPSLTGPLACASCHVVPAAVVSPGHLDGVVEIAFSGLATARGAAPTWDGTTCTNVACHGAVLADPPAIPRWNDASMAASACGACHGIPPSEHTTSTSCERSTCHGTEVARNSAGVLSITTAGLALHVNGVVDHGGP